MKGNDQRQREIDALGTLVDRFGADRTRWPAPDRLRFATLLKESAEARRTLAEAEALDRLLDEAPLVDAGRHGALCDRIVARALAETAGATAAPRADRSMAGEVQGSQGSQAAPGSEAERGNVADLAAARASRRPAPSRLPRFGSRLAASAWPAAALLAASLAIGIFAGSSGLLPTTNFGLTVASSDADYYGRAFALGTDGGATADEDTL